MLAFNKPLRNDDKTWPVYIVFRHQSIKAEGTQGAPQIRYCPKVYWGENLGQIKKWISQKVLTKYSYKIYNVSNSREAFDERFCRLSDRFR